MTRICIFRTAKGDIAGFEAKGHTGYGETGLDIVCSAISAVTQTALMGITELLKLDAGVTVKKGNLYCMLDKNIDESAQKAANLIFETMLLGLGSIKQNYHDNYLEICEREV